MSILSDKWDEIAVQAATRNYNITFVRLLRQTYYAGAIQAHKALLLAAQTGAPEATAQVMAELTHELVQVMKEKGEFE